MPPRGEKQDAADGTRQGGTCRSCRQPAFPPAGFPPPDIPLGQNAQAYSPDLTSPANLDTTAAAEQNKLDPKQLPGPVHRSRLRMMVAHKALDLLLTPLAPADAKARRKADRVIDRAWSATFDWLTGWCKLPSEENPHFEATGKLFALVFDDALAFTRLPYRLEWSESKSRLDAIAQNGHQATFDALGGANFLTNLKKAHAAYGIALNITVPVVEEVTGVVRPALQTLLTAARRVTTWRVSRHMVSLMSRGRRRWPTRCLCR